MSEVSYNVEPGVTLSPEETAAAGYEAGFTNTSDLATLVNITQSESGGNPGAIGIGVPPGDSEYSLGLAQINVAPGANESLGKKYGASGLLTPISNLAAAHSLFLSSPNWGDWPSGEVAAAKSSGPGAEAAQELATLAPAQIAQLADNAQNAASAAFEAEGGAVPPTYQASTAPPSLGNVPVNPDLQTGQLGTTPQGTPNGGSATSSTPGTTITTTGSSSWEDTAASKNPFGRVLIQVNGLLNPPSPGGLTQILTLGTIDIAYAIETGATRLAFAIPGIVGLLLALAGGVFGILDVAKGPVQKVQGAAEVVRNPIKAVSKPKAK